jgi:hypothetical protein
MVERKALSNLKGHPFDVQVANSNVRRNALLLLVDVFPLQDPDACKEEKEAMLEKQFNLFEKLLLDVSPEVRSVAVEGVCRILRLFWEIVPSSAAVQPFQQTTKTVTSFLLLKHGVVSCTYYMIVLKN